ncbi:HTTM domain-containing protein [Chryseolinea lacunae]|uniref:HTTM domain-containing protein n=1 Tax=Chryseolinea lacunae TaxID=2801331 RepID=A0ABS1KWF2_9BACT|nr:HTTM domain-containing protein [Chryseolinea lacunae]MBL0743660.1 HTTM domain-containing protein [Chryseolinea lacunae]
MHALRTKIAIWGEALTGSIREPKATMWFVKSLVGYALLKLIFLWPAAAVMLRYHTLTLPRSWAGKLILAPAVVANLNVHVFFASVIAFLAVMLFVRVNFRLNLVFFWLMVNLYVVNLPSGNGSDLVLLMLSFWCILIDDLRQGRGDDALATTAHNVGRLLCQLQIVMLYAVSGWDKLMSESWRTGEAWAYIRNLDVLANTYLHGLLQGPTLNVLFAWSTIAFECLFVVLVWFKRTRLPMLFVGTVIHLGIWILLSLPDFGLVMIVSYVVFLKDEDVARLRGWIRR